MKTDEPRDDEILGRALSRAIETAEVKETPYEGSRIALHPKKSGSSLWRVAALAASVAIAVALGSTLLDRPAVDQSVGQQPTPTAATNPQGASATPGSPSSTAQPDAIDHRRVFIARDGLPPTSQHLDSVLGDCAACLPGMSGVPTTAEDRIRSRLNSLNRAFSGLAATPLNVDIKTAYPASVRVNGDAVTVDYYLASGSWPVRGAAASLAWEQQLVYTATEEPGIRRVLFTQDGGKPMRIDQIVMDKALTREDVSGYSSLGSTGRAQGFGDASPAAARKLTTRTSVDAIAPGVARVEIETDLQNPSPTVSYPDFTVEVFQNDETAKPVGGKWRLVVTVNGNDSVTGLQIIDKSPLRSLVAGAPKCVGCSGTIYEIGLDDLRPWRTAIAFNPFRIIIDIGGDPRTIFDSNAVNAPAYGATVGATFQVSGVAHNFEAHVDIIVRDDRDKEILRTSTTGTNCCDPGGTFAATVRLPAGTTGKIYLEVYEGSARDGSVTKLIRIPLTVR